MDPAAIASIGMRASVASGEGSQPIKGNSVWYDLHIGIRGAVLWMRPSRFFKIHFY
jgi:hypothetical protein